MAKGGVSGGDVRSRVHESRAAHLHAKLARPRGFPNRCASARPRVKRKNFWRTARCWFKSSDAANRETCGDSASTKTPPHERYLEAFRWMLQTRDFRGQARQSLPRRSDYRRRLHRQRPGSGQRRLRIFLQEGRCLRTAHSRSGRALRFRRTAARCGAHLSRFAHWARCADATETFIAVARRPGSSP